MSSVCPHLNAIQTWAKQGVGEPMPPDLHRHASHCPSCKSLVEDIERVRNLVSRLPTASLTSSRADAMRFELLAAARRESPVPIRPPTRSLRRALLGSAALLASMVLMVLVFQVLATEPPAVSQASSPILAVVSPVPDGRPAPVQNLVYTKEVPEPTKEVPERSRGKPSECNGTFPNGCRSSNQASRPPARHRPKVTSEPGPTGTITPTAEFDRRFAMALAQFHSGSALDAARLFDMLAEEKGVEDSRRSDALYWSARSHQAAGDKAVSATKAKELVTRSPSSWHADEAALLAASSLLDQGDKSSACLLLERAVHSQRTATKLKATELLGRCRTSK